MQTESGLRFGVIDKSTGRSCSLQHVHYDITIEDSFLRMVMTQEFENDRDTSAELQYRFAQNEKSTIHDITVELYDPVREERRILRAEVEEKKKAQERYDDAIASGDSAMLAESDAKDPGSVILSLGNVGAHWQVTVRLSSVEEVAVEHVDDEQEMRNLVRETITIPSLNRSGQGLEGVGVENTSVAVSVSLTDGGEEQEGEDDLGSQRLEILSIKSSSHDAANFECSIEGDKLSGTIKTREDRNLSMNQDVIFVVEVADTPLVSGLIEENTAVVSVLPVFEAEKMPLCTEVIVVVDCSGSMAGSRIECARTALLTFFQRVFEVGQDREVYFNIVRFGSSHESLYSRGSRELTSKTLRAAKNYVDTKVKSDLGGTRMLPPLREILSRDVVVPGFSRQVMFLTDGEDEQTEEVIQFVQRNASTTRIFSFGIGRGINPVLITRVAQVSNGRAVFVESNSDIQDAVVEQIRYAMQPALTGVKIDFHGDAGPVSAKNYLSAIPPCFNYQKYALYFRLDSPAKTATVAFGIGTGKSARRQCQVSLRTVTNHLNTLGARRRVLELGDGKNAVQSEKEAIEEEIRELGMSGHFISSQTSFIMVAENESQAMGEIAVEVVPTIVPKDREPARAQPSYSSVSYGAAAYDDDDDYGGSFSLSAAPRRSRARRSRGCFANSNRVRVIRESGKPIEVSLGEIREGDLVESVRGVGIHSTDSARELAVSYELCIGCCHHISPRHCFFFETASGAYVGMTGIHLLQIQRKDADSMKFECVLAKDVRIGDRVLVTSGDSILSSPIIRITEREETVSMVYTSNGSMMISGMLCSCFATQTRFKPFFVAKKLYYLLPKCLRVQSWSHLVDGVVHELFVREDTTKLHQRLVSSVMGIHNVVGGVKDDDE